jgi:hypothetical protein
MENHNKISVHRRGGGRLVSFYEGVLQQFGIEAANVRFRDIKMKPIELSDRQAQRLKDWRKPGFNHAIVTGVEAHELFYKKTDLNYVHVKWIQTVSESGMAMIFPKEYFENTMIGGAL